VPRLVQRVAAALGAVALLVWLLALAGALDLSAVEEWVVFGVGVGLLALARIARALSVP